MGLYENFRYCHIWGIILTSRVSLCAFIHGHVIVWPWIISVALAINLPTVCVHSPVSIIEVNNEKDSLRHAFLDSGNHLLEPKHSFSVLGLLVNAKPRAGLDTDICVMCHVQRCEVFGVNCNNTYFNDSMPSTTTFTLIY